MKFFNILSHSGTEEMQKPTEKTGKERNIQQPVSHGGTETRRNTQGRDCFSVCSWLLEVRAFPVFFLAVPLCLRASVRDLVVEFPLVPAPLGCENGSVSQRRVFA